MVWKPLIPWWSIVWRMKKLDMRKHDERRQTYSGEDNVQLSGKRQCSICEVWLDLVREGFTCLPWLGGIVLGVIVSLTPGATWGCRVRVHSEGATVAPRHTPWLGTTAAAGLHAASAQPACKMIHVLQHHWHPCLQLQLLLLYSICALNILMLCINCISCTVVLWKAYNDP